MCNTLATWCKELTHWKRPWSWARLKAGEGENRGWDGWMSSLTLWTWVWASSGSCDLQGTLACCSPWCCKELDRTKEMNWPEMKSLQWCPTLCDYILPRSSVHVFLQARILEWMAMPSSRGYSWPRDWTHISWGFWSAGRFFITQPPGKHIY